VWSHCAVTSFAKAWRKMLNVVAMDVTDAESGGPSGKPRHNLRDEPHTHRVRTPVIPRFLARLASDHRKPDGLFVITPKMRPAFVEILPVEKFHGVGPATTAKMNRLGIKTGFDLREQTLAFLQQHFGKPGPYYYWIARGVDERPVRVDRIRKSLGAENTFSADIFTFEAACEVLQPIIEKIWRTCEGAETRGRTVTVKVKYDLLNYEQSALLKRLRREAPAFVCGCRSRSGWKLKVA
jgi:nucleotidyltransferase/DNA polymerase involved in DNA repair